ncbi:ammonia channel protein [Sesbania bispinosa]|nr:ammonia channel protein [Sesbania bispinosa]
MRVTSNSRREEYFHRGDDLHLLERILLLTASSIESEEMMQHNTSSGSWLIRSSSSPLFFIPFIALFVVGLDIVFICKEKALKSWDSKVK